MLKRAVLTFLMLFSFSFITLRSASSFFVSTAVSSNNTFSTAEEFPSVTPTETPTPTPDEGLASHVVISEVQIEGSSAGNDFIELYNPTNQSIDVSGWKLRKKDSTGGITSVRVFSTGSEIPAHGFLLWASESNDFHLLVESDESSTITLTSGDRSVALLDNNDIEIDKLSWGVGTNQYIEGSAFSQTPTANQSLERKAYSTSDATSMTAADASKGNAYDTDNNSLNFILRTTSQPQNSSSAIELP